MQMKDDDIKVLTQKAYSIDNCKVSMLSLFAIYMLVYGGYVKLLFPLTSSAIDVLQIAAAGICVFLIGKISISKGRHVTTFMMMILSLLLMSATIIYTNNPGTGKSRLVLNIMTIIYMLVLFIGSARIHANQVDNLLRNLLIINKCLVLLYFVVYIGKFLSSISAGGRLGDQAGNSIWLGRLCGEQILIILAINNWKLKFIDKMWLLFFLMAIIMTGSKGPIFSVVLIAVIHYMTTNKLSLKKMLVIFGLVLALACAAYLVSNATSFFVVNRFSLDVVMSTDPDYRMSRFSYTISHIPETLIKGHGLGSWPKNYWTFYNIPDRLVDYPHNIVLEMLYECGIIATGLWILSIFGAYSIYKDTKKTSVFILFLLLLYNVLCAMFSGSIVDGNRGIYYFFAICCSIGRSLKNWSIPEGEVNRNRNKSLYAVMTS